MTESSSDWKFHFTLSEKIDCKEIIPKIKDFELEFNRQKGQKSITGFHITVENSTEDIAKEIASKKAQIFTDILAVTSGTASRPRRDAQSQIHSTGRQTISKTITFVVDVKNPADLDIPKDRLEDILENKDPTLSRKMRYVNMALDSITKKNPASAIKELVLACGENLQGDLAKYRSLRNALSHESVCTYNIINIQENFGTNYFEFISKNRFDYISNHNLENLSREAYSFLTQVRKNVRREI